MNFVFKMMDFALKMMNFVLKMRIVMEISKESAAAIYGENTGNPHCNLPAISDVLTDCSRV